MHHKLISYDVCFLRHGPRRAKCFVILDHFLPFYPPNNPENQNFEKMKRTPGGIIILHKCSINHMVYGSRDIGHDRQNFLSTWVIFSLLPPFTTWKIKILKKWKKPGDIIIIHNCIKNHDHMVYCSWDMVYGCNFIFHFGQFF